MLFPSLTNFDSFSVFQNRRYSGTHFEMTMIVLNLFRWRNATEFCTSVEKADSGPNTVPAPSLRQQEPGGTTGLAMANLDSWGIEDALHEFAVANY